MRQSLGLLLSIILHASLAAIAVFGLGGQAVKVNMDRPVYTVDLVSLAPPPPLVPAPVVEVPAEAVPDSSVPQVEAQPDSVVEVKKAPVVEAKPEPEVKKISPKKVEKKDCRQKKGSP